MAQDRQAQDSVKAANPAAAVQRGPGLVVGTVRENPKKKNPWRGDREGKGQVQKIKKKKFKSQRFTFRLGDNLYVSGLLEHSTDVQQKVEDDNSLKV